jgi:hypothetical protein
MFKPTAAQSKVKAQFHAAISRNPLIGDVSTMPTSEMARHSGSKSIQGWKSEDGFTEWFLNPQSNKELLESSVCLGIQSLIDILGQECDGERGSPKAADKINATKVLMSFAGYGPKDQKKDEEEKDSVDDLSAAELDKEIAKLSVIAED